MTDLEEALVIFKKLLHCVWPLNAPRIHEEGYIERYTVSYS